MKPRQFKHLPMKTIASIFFLTSLAGATLQARVGETIAQCEARYGEPSKALDGNTINFLKDGMVITVEHWAGKCVQITYCREEPLPIDEIELILEVNAVTTADGKWTKRSGGLATITTWSTTNRTRFAMYETIGFTLVITDLKAIAPLNAHRDASSKASASAKLKGF